MSRYLYRWSDERDSLLQISPRLSPLYIRLMEICCRDGLEFDAEATFDTILEVMVHHGFEAMHMCEGGRA